MKTIVIFGVLILLTACAPTFSELQSARTVGKDKVEFTPSFSAVQFASDGQINSVQNHVGLQLAFGLSDKLDFRLRTEYIWLTDEFSNGIGMIGFGPKYNFVLNRVSFYLPIGRAVGQDTGDTWGMHPTLLLTQPLLKEKVELTLSPKYLFPFCKDCSDLIAVNLGLAISSKISNWSIRPEFGVLCNPQDQGVYTQFSFGFSRRF